MKTIITQDDICKTLTANINKHIAEAKKQQWAFRHFRHSNYVLAAHAKVRRDADLHLAKIYRELLTRTNKENLYAYQRDSMPNSSGNADDAKMPNMHV